ncbi:MAG: hypothetical protein JJU11_10985 [Candidatus Sumerlaeia bacterium]|nr:hypothetical protein [Candidatus Sumerlaeia bacterium]
MPVFPISKFDQLRPDWKELGAGPPERQETTSLTIVQHNRTYLVFSGRAMVTEGTASNWAQAGDIILIRAGVSFQFQAMTPDFAIMRLGGPGRAGTGSLEGKAPAPSANLPEVPVPGSASRGVSFQFDPTMTFSPGMLTRGKGNDLFLTCQLGALAQSQVSAIRSHCLEMNSQLVALHALVEDDEDAANYFDDPGMRKSLLHLRPRYLAVEADPSTARGQGMAAIIQNRWQRVAHVECIDLALMVTLREWNAGEVRELFGWLMQRPPSKMKLILRWNPEKFEATPELLKVIAAMLPWIVGIDYQGRNGYEEVCGYFEKRGFQGWIFQGVGI